MSNSLRKLFFVTLVGFGIFCLCKGLPSSVTRRATDGFMADAVASADRQFPAAIPGTKVRTQAIETIRVGQRVLAKNPEVSNIERRARGKEPNFAGWLHLTLEMPKPDGSKLTINMLRSEEWLRNQIGYVVGEKSDPSGEPLGVSPPSSSQESGQPKAESRASQTSISSLEAQGDAPQTENLKPKTATDPDLWDIGIAHSPLVPLSPLRPIFTEILLTSLAIEEEGAELVGMTVQMDLPELGLTGEAIVVDIEAAPPIEPLVDRYDTRQVVTATFHHSSGDVIDLVVGESQNGKAESRVATGTPANPDRLSAFRSPLSPGGEVGHSDHEPRESTDTIGTTSNHPFWSVDRQEYVQAGSLEIGERLQTVSGDVKVVQQKLPRPGPEPVFNLEVHAEHVYFVGEDGVLVHNAYSDFKAAVARYASMNGANEPKVRWAYRLLREGQGSGNLGTYKNYMANHFGISNSQNLGAITRAFNIPGHGNQLGTQLATLYAKFKNGVFHKWGITEHEDPSKRYSGLGPDDEVIRIERGPRNEMAELERFLTERIPGPKNKESWAGKIKRGDPRY